MRRRRTPPSLPASTDTESSEPPNPLATPPPANGNLFPSTGPQSAPRPGRHQSSRLTGNKTRRGARAEDLLQQEADADPLDVRVAFRRAKTAAMARDPEMAEDLVRAAGASTDREKRLWLRQYYERLFSLVQKIDKSPELAAHVALLSKIAEQRYNPRRRAVAGEEDLVNGRHGRGR